MRDHGIDTLTVLARRRIGEIGAEYSATGFFQDITFTTVVRAIIVIVPNPVMGHGFQKRLQDRNGAIVTSPVPQSPLAVIIHFPCIPGIAEPKHEVCFFTRHGFENAGVLSVGFTRAIVCRLIEVGARSGQERKIWRRFSPLPQFLGLE